MHALTDAHNVTEMAPKKYTTVAIFITFSYIYYNYLCRTFALNYLTDL